MFRPLSHTNFRKRVMEGMKIWKQLDYIYFGEREKGTKVDFGDKFIYFAVDTTDIPVHFCEDWGYKRNQCWSMKNKQYSVKIETGVTFDGIFVWYNGIFFHNFADISIFRSGLKSILELDECCFGDKGYQGEDVCVVPYKKKKDGPPLTVQEDLHNQFVTHWRAIVENLNADLKKWGILRFYFGENLEFLMESFILICNIINIKRGRGEIDE